MPTTEYAALNCNESDFILNIKFVLEKSICF